MGLHISILKTSAICEGLQGENVQKERRINQHAGVVDKQLAPHGSAGEVFMLRGRTICSSRSRTRQQVEFSRIGANYLAAELLVVWGGQVDVLVDNRCRIASGHAQQLKVFDQVGDF